jgi:hypothetical protein
MGLFSDLKDYRALLREPGFWVLLVATVLIVSILAVLYVWLSDTIGWPEAYGFRCRGRGCWIEHLMHSQKLLGGGSRNELAFFALLWWMPALLACTAVYTLVKRRLRNRNPIQPMKTK